MIGIKHLVPADPTPVVPVSQHPLHPSFLSVCYPISDLTRYYNCFDAMLFASDPLYLQYHRTYDVLFDFMSTNNTEISEFKAFLDYHHEPVLSESATLRAAEALVDWDFPQEMNAIMNRIYQCMTASPLVVSLQTALNYSDGLLSYLPTNASEAAFALYCDKGILKHDFVVNVKDYLSHPQFFLNSRVVYSHIIDHIDIQSLNAFCEIFD